ncbi:MAG: hypothetical protein ACM358_00220 [Gemmatimonadota bacterium]
MSVSGRAEVGLIVVSLFLVTPARAQLIQVKTLPLAQGNQFQIFPSANVGMASVSIALADSALDPFVNPATGSRVQASRFFGSPTVYSISRGTGGGRSLPLALLVRRANWYGGLALAVQQVDPSRPPSNGGVVAIDAPLPGGGPFGPGQLPVQANNEAHGNQFAFASIGRRMPERHMSIGASMLWNGLHAVDGVDLLYANSRRLEQSGDAVDLRVGALKEWPTDSGKGARSLQAILLHNRFAATHTVTYADQIWNPITQLFDEQARIEYNEERTNTWGLQLNYQIPLAAPGWRIGWVAVANRASHPKIPTYELTNVPAIPRDPGYTHAFNLGMGVSRVEGPARFGIDLIYEPISSYTWADAAVPTPTAAGDTIAPGGKTIENRFRFDNAWFRLGVEQPMSEGAPTSFQLGLILHPIKYRLEQRDNVQLSSRSADACWWEWTPTWGLSYRQTRFELRYQGRVTKGAGRPQTQFVIGPFRALDAAGSTLLAAPSGPLFMTDVSTVTHQISISLPLR